MTGWGNLFHSAGAAKVKLKLFILLSPEIEETGYFQPLPILFWCGFEETLK